MDQKTKSTLIWIIFIVVVLGGTIWWYAGYRSNYISASPSIVAPPYSP